MSVASSAYDRVNKGLTSVGADETAVNTDINLTVVQDAI